MLSAGNTAHESTKVPVRPEMDMFHDEDESVDVHRIAVIKEREENENSHEG